MASALDYRHATVMAGEVAELLRPAIGKLMVDGTLGGGGHAERLLQGGARVLGLDRDPVAVEAARERLARFRDRLTTQVANFAQLRSLLGQLKIPSVDGIVLDLGISSPQIDEAARGFSFTKEAPLDMRMGPDAERADELIARLSEEELTGVIREYGEERFAGRIAREIKRRPPSTTVELARICAEAIPRKAWPKHIHPATRTFQALRMACNRELESLAALLDDLPALVAPGGRVAIISFHSLEDREVKRTFRKLEGACTCPPGLPVCACGAKGSFRVLTKRALVPSAEEIAENPRARSAKLRAVERSR